MATSARLSSVQVGLATLTANPLRTALSTLGIVMGSASLVAVLALGDGLEKFARSQIESTTDLHSISVTPELVKEVDGLRLVRTDTIHLDPAEAAQLIQDLPGLDYVTLILAGGAELQATVPGVPRAAPVRAVWYRGSASPERLQAGRAFTAEESGSDARVAVVSDSLARTLTTGHIPAAAVGTSLVVNGTPFQVLGVVTRREMGERPEIAVPFGAAGQALAGGLGPRVPTLTISAGTLEATGPLRTALEDRLSRRYGTWRGRMRVASNASRLEQARQGLLVFKLVMGAITGISLLVGGIGIMNVLLAGVVERTREIGIRKAAGAKRRDILTQFLAESVAIACAGAFIGTVLGVSGAFGVTAFVRARTQAQMYAGFSWSSVAISALSAITVGLVFGCYPALRAAKLSPIDAIRHE